MFHVISDKLLVVLRRSIIKIKILVVISILIWRKVLLLSLILNLWSVVNKFAFIRQNEILSLIAFKVLFYDLLLMHFLAIPAWVLNVLEELALINVVRWMFLQKTHGHVWILHEFVRELAELRLLRIWFIEEVWLQWSIEKRGVLGKVVNFLNIASDGTVLLHDLLVEDLHHVL